MIMEITPRELEAVPKHKRLQPDCVHDHPSRHISRRLNVFAFCTYTRLHRAALT
jgi:hypothetical protein